MFSDRIFNGVPIALRAAEGDEDVVPGRSARAHACRVDTHVDAFWDRVFNESVAVEYCDYLSGLEHGAIRVQILNMSEFEQLLRESLSESCRLTTQQVGLLEGHFALLNQWNRTLNLTSIRNLPDAVTRHYGESLFLAAHLPEKCASVADLGSGAGFPGIPLAILRPECSVTLIESHQRKAVFLKEATRHLGNVRVLAKRAEAVDERFEWLVSRAVAPKEVLQFVPRLASNLALLLAQEDAAKLIAHSKLRFEKPIPTPCLTRSVLLLGSS